MDRRSALALVAAASVGLTACGDQAIFSPVAPTREIVSDPASAGRYLVGFADQAVISPDVLAAAGGRIIDSIPALHVLVVDGVTNPDALRNAQPSFIDAGFDVNIDPIRDLSTLGDLAQVVEGQENTPWVQSGVLWGMKTIHAEDAWARTSGGLGVNVCIVDTGVDDKHQELSGGKVIMRANFVPSPAATPGSEDRIDDPHGHGSHVSGTVAARGVVISGVAPRASIMGARVLSTAGSGSETSIINGINWCVANGAHVINMSLGGTRYRAFASYQASQVAYGTAIKNANDAGVVVITSSGNSNVRLPNPVQTTVPALIPGAISVGATGPLSKSTAPAAPAWNPFDPAQVWRSVDRKAYYSNFGTAVSVFAPGGRGGIPLSEIYRVVGGVGQGGPYDQIFSICSSNTSQSGPANSGGVPSGSGSCLGNVTRYIAYAGTSMAAPHVSGLAAILYGELGGARSAANRARVESCIRTTTDYIGASTTYGGGRINVTRAIDGLRNNSC